MSSPPVAIVIGVRAVERFDADPALFSARFTVELLKPVPLSVLQVTCTTLRPGKRVRIIGASVTHDDVEVARATVLRVRNVADDVDEFLPVDHAPSTLPDQYVAAPRLVADTVGIMDGMEVRAPESAATMQGPAMYWFRMRFPLLDDEPIDPMSTALMAADFGNGISSVVPIDTHFFINPDLTVYLHRRPTGEWIANDAQTWVHPGGGSVAEAALWDVTGQIGRATQSLYVARR